MIDHSTTKKQEQLKLQNVLLKEKLTEAEDALKAIRNGKVDAIIVNTPQGYKVFSLSSSETPYRVIVEEMNEGAATISAEGLILYCNSRFAKLVDMPIEKVVGCNFNQFIDDAKLPEFNLLLKDAIKKKFTKETSFKVKTNTKGHFQLSFSPLPPNMLGNICIMTMDITELKHQEVALRQSLLQTEQKKAELINTNKALQIAKEALSQSLEKFRTVADFTHDWEYWEGKDSAIIYTSPSCERITGYKAEELMADSSLLLKMIHPDDAALVYDHFNTIHSNSENFTEAKRIDFRIIKKDGAVVYIGHICSPVFDNNGHYNGRRISNRDITDRKNIEQTLKKSEERYRGLFNNLEAGIIVHAPDTSIIFSNPKAAQLLGISQDQMQGKLAVDSGWKFLDNDNQPLPVNKYPVNQVTASRHEIKNFLLGANRPSTNDFVWLEVSGIPIMNNKGEIVEIVISFIDITERKYAEEKILELNKDLDKKVTERTGQYENVNKELEAFTYSVSHDLRAPLRAITSYSQILQEDYIEKLDEDGKIIIGNINRNGQKMARLIDDLLDFSRLGRKDIVKTEVNMNELTNAAVMELKQLSPNHAKIKIGHLPVLQADYSLMYQVMFNLVSNGIKYSSKKEKPIITINAVQIKDKLTFVIKDNGAGFDMQYANKLFGVFQRLHSEEEFEGNGVGLSIVKRIINKFGGEVWGEGKVDEGATFYFTLN